MKLKWILLSGAVLAGALALTYTGLARAASFRAANSITFGRDQVVDSSVFAAGQTIDIAGEVHGDIFCAGRDVNISAKVDGDVICAGEQIRVSGPVSGSVRLAGKDVHISAKVDGSASLAGSNLTLEGDSRVGRDLSAAGENLRLNGTVERDASLAAASVRLDGKVGRSLEARTDSLALGSHAVIGGDLSYRSPNEARLEPGAQVRGATNHSAISKHNRISNMNFRRYFAGAFFYWLLATLATAAVLALLAPRLLEAGEEVIRSRPGRTALLGLASLIVVPVLIGLLMVSLVGIPLGIVLILLWLLGLVLSGPLFAVFVGKKLFSGSSLLVATLSGSLVLLVAYWIPVIGFVAGVAALLLGLGGYVSVILQRASPRPVFASGPQPAAAKNGKPSKSAGSRKTKK